MKNKNLPLIIGIALPVLFIGIISIVIFTPSLFVNPKYNFLYSTDDAYYYYNQGYRNNYKVDNNRLISEVTQTQPGVAYTYRGDAPNLFLYDVKADTSHQIDFTEAKKLFLDPGPSSPDGYIVKYEYNNDGIFELFGSRNNNSGYFISKDSGKKKLTGLTGNNNNYYNQGPFNFIGWIK